MKFTFLRYCVTAVLFSFICTIVGAVPQDTTKSSVKKVFYGQASFYANKFNGRKTANGEIFDQKKFTCACNAVKLGTWLRVTNVRNGKSVIVKVNDRIHPRMRRVVDLTSGAARQIGITAKHGLGRVKVEVLGKKKPKA
ncbi:MAG: septal ring lytic transglycosylase RlpA family protein [Bacteroidota bacterium]